jgi:hypothetical protein
MAGFTMDSLWICQFIASEPHLNGDNEVLNHVKPIWILSVKPIWILSAPFWTSPQFLVGGPFGRNPYLFFNHAI